METRHYLHSRTVLTAPARALTAKRIFVMTFFIGVAVGVYDLFTYLALLMEGEPLGVYWNAYGLLPLVWMKLGNPAAAVLYGVGLIGALLALMVGMFGVSLMEIEQIRGNRFLSAVEAIKLCFRRLRHIAVAELAVVVFLAFIIILMLLLGLITRIPVIGDWIYTLTFVVPGFVVALFTVFIIAVLQISVILLPAVEAADRKGEAFTAILETFSTVIRRPVRWLAYTGYGLVAAKVCSFVYAYFCYRAVQLLAWTMSWTAGNKAITLVRSGLSHLPATSDVMRETTRVFPGVDWSFSISRWALSGGDPAAGHIMAFMLFVIFASIIGYALATVATVQARGYAIIRYLKDEYNVADEEPLGVEPPVPETDEAESNAASPSDDSPNS